MPQCGSSALISTQAPAFLPTIRTNVKPREEGKEGLRITRKMVLVMLTLGGLWVMLRSTFEEFGNTTVKFILNTSKWWPQESETIRNSRLMFILEKGTPRPSASLPDFCSRACENWFAYLEPVPAALTWHPEAGGTAEQASSLVRILEQMNHPHVDNGAIKLLLVLVSSSVEKRQNCIVKNYRSPK